MTKQQRAAKRLADGTAQEELVGPARVANLWTDALRRLLANRAAVLGLVLIVIIMFTAIFAKQVAPYDYAAGDADDNYVMPAWLIKVLPGNVGAYVKTDSRFALGADYLGRDLLSRIIYGTRVSLTVGFAGALTALLIGLIYGCIAGYYGARTDDIMMRIVDIMYAFPTILLIILMMTVFKTNLAGTPEPGSFADKINQFNGVVDHLLGLQGGGMLFIFMGIGLTAWMGTSRLARGQILSLKEKEFIEASHMIGARDLRIITRHILPNIVGPILVNVTLAIPGFINTEVFLSFIGLGVDPPTPSWGSMISQGATSMRSYPNQIIFPALALAVTMFAFNFLGDGLRDALDPRMKGKI